MLETFPSFLSIVFSPSPFAVDYRSFLENGIDLKRVPEPGETLEGMTRRRKRRKKRRVQQDGELSEPETQHMDVEQEEGHPYAGTSSLNASENATERVSFVHVRPHGQTSKITLEELNRRMKVREREGGVASAIAHFLRFSPPGAGTAR